VTDTYKWVGLQRVALSMGIPCSGVG
jgi:hypothetical protein